MEREIHPLRDWVFAYGDTVEALSAGHPVTLPHTWNVEEGLEDAAGLGWYRCTFQVPQLWEGCAVRVRFEAVYHDAAVFLNGQRIAEHRRSGYTPFTVELTGHLLYGGENTLVVRADNRYSEEMLPCGRSFDWANDGGLIRDAALLVTGKSYLCAVRTVAQPIILSEGERQEGGAAILGTEATLGGAPAQGLSLDWALLAAGTGRELAAGSVACAQGGAVLPRRIVEGLNYWHFDNPALYTLRLCLRGPQGVEDTLERTVGFRDFRVRGARFYLNGEAVRLCGSEWMPGSDPAYGAAEPKGQLEKMLRRLKESNCVFTRFHWQQDDAVYDWCDRNGMLVQEEVPFWGRSPEVAGGLQLEIFRQQAAEMAEAHGHHPSIVCWGVGNELDAQAAGTLQYIKDAIAYMRGLDPSRPVNYVSNSFYEGAGSDGTTCGDIMMINEYTGTWRTDAVADDQIQKVLRETPGKPLVPSEFGLCEPAFSGGDARREQIFLEKMATYCRYPQIAGTIYFCLNDYRTQMGEEGSGKRRRRVHGSTGLDGTPKPSYYAVQRECAPFTVERDGGRIRLLCRRDLPCYAMKGYTATLLDGDGKAGARLHLPDLAPGEAWETNAPAGSKISVYRPNGAFAGTY